MSSSFLARRPCQFFKFNLCMLGSSCPLSHQLPPRRAASELEDQEENPIHVPRSPSPKKPQPPERPRSPSPLDDDLDDLRKCIEREIERTASGDNKGRGGRKETDLNHAAAVFEPKTTVGFFDAAKAALPPKLESTEATNKKETDGTTSRAESPLRLPTSLHKPPPGYRGRPQSADYFTQPAGFYTTTGLFRPNPSSAPSIPPPGLLDSSLYGQTIPGGPPMNLNCSPPPPMSTNLRLPPAGTTIPMEPQKILNMLPSHPPPLRPLRRPTNLRPLPAETTIPVAPQTILNMLPSHPPPFPRQMCADPYQNQGAIPRIPMPNHNIKASREYRELRRPAGLELFVSKSYFCHMCKQDLPQVNPNLTCPLCLGDFVEESQSVERAPTPPPMPTPMPTPSLMEDIQWDEKADTVGNSIDLFYWESEDRPTSSPKRRVMQDHENLPGFAWVPPKNLFQSFLKKDDKLKNWKVDNPYLYLEDEDCVDDYFPDLGRPLPESQTVKPRKQRLYSEATTVGSYEDSDGRNGDNSEMHPNRVSRLEKRRRKKEARKAILRERKLSERQDYELREQARQDNEEAEQRERKRTKSERERSNREKEQEALLAKMRLRQELNNNL